MITQTERKEATAKNHFFQFEKYKIPKNKKGNFIANEAAKILMFPVFPYNLEIVASASPDFKESNNSLHANKDSINTKTPIRNAIL